MWIVISLVVTVIAVLMAVRHRRTARTAFDRLSRDDQVQEMRNREGGDAHRGSRDGAKSRALGEHFGSGGYGSP